MREVRRRGPQRAELRQGGSARRCQPGAEEDAEDAQGRRGAFDLGLRGAPRTPRCAEEGVGDGRARDHGHRGARPVSLRSRISAAARALFNYPTPEDGIVPGWRDSILNHPYRLDPMQWDHAKAVRLISTVRACVLQRAEDIASMPVVIERETSTGWEPIERA